MAAQHDTRRAIDPAEIFDAVAVSGSDLPERRLMAAILFDAVLQLSRDGSKGAVEAARWIREREDETTPFSFAVVCDGLGLDTEYLARGLLEWKASGGAQRGPLPTRRAFATDRRRRVALAAPRRRAHRVAAS
jgi:hypothetical protein